MAFNNEQQKLIDATKSLYLLKYKDITDEKLEEISNHLRTVGVFSSNTTEALKALGELEACNEIMSQRRARKQYKKDLERTLKFAFIFWEEALAERRQKAVLNLPAATSYHGQLVAAVLDAEDDLTADEIRLWSDELEAMDDDLYRTLLQELVNEQIIVAENGKYSLLTLCTEDLFPSDPLRLAGIRQFLSYDSDFQNQLVQSDKNILLPLHDESDFSPMKRNWLDGDAKAFLQKMVETGTPLTERDWIEINGMSYDLEKMEENPVAAYRSARNTIKNYAKAGIFSMFPIANLGLNILRDDLMETKNIPGEELNFYYLPILGEKEAK